MSHNLQYQLKDAIDFCFKEGMDKHAFKRANGFVASDKIFSFAARKDLIQTSANLAKWIQHNYPEIRQVTNINSNHINHYIDQKKETCAILSVEQYAHRINKLQYVLNKKFVSANLEWKIQTITAKGKKLRDVVFKREHLQQILEYKKDSSSRVAVDLAGRFGLRVEECVTLKAGNIDLKRRLLTVIGKGGRSRELYINDTNLSALEAYKRGKPDNQRIVMIKPDTVNTYLSRCCLELGIHDYEGYKSGVHAIRKMVAQEYYDSCRNQGMDKSAALGAVNVFLGHGYDRKELNVVYVANQW